MRTNSHKMLARVADRVDLAIDFLTLGQYGLESCEGRAHERPAATGLRVREASASWAGCEGGEEICFDGFPRREARQPARTRGRRCEPAPAARPQPAAA